MVATPYRSRKTKTSDGSEWLGAASPEAAYSATTKQVTVKQVKMKYLMNQAHQCCQLQRPIISRKACGKPTSKKQRQSDKLQLGFPVDLNYYHKIVVDRFPGNYIFMLGCESLEKIPSLFGTNTVCLQAQDIMYVLLSSSKWFRKQKVWPRALLSTFLERWLNALIYGDLDLTH